MAPFFVLLAFAAVGLVVGSWTLLAIFLLVAGALSALEIEALRRRVANLETALASGPATAAASPKVALEPPPAPKPSVSTGGTSRAPGATLGAAGWTAAAVGGAAIEVTPPGVAVAQAGVPARARGGGSAVAGAVAVARSGEGTGAADAGPSLLDRVFAGAVRALGPTGSSAEAIEAWLSGRLLAIVGGAALLLGSLFFLSLAFSRGWISEPIRVLIGIFAGLGMVGLAVWLFTRRFDVLAHVLVGVGLATQSLALYAAAPLYHLVPVELALVGSLLTTVAAALVAIRFDSQLVAGMGVVSLLTSPPILGAGPELATVAYLGVALIGTTAIAVARSWRWLPPIAFVLSVPQLLAFVLDSPDPAFAIPAVLGYWTLYAIAAGGEEWRHRRRDLQPGSATLLLAATCAALAAGFLVLSGDSAAWRPAYVIVLAIGHWILAAAFLRREGDRHIFGLLTAATGLAAFSIAPPLHFGGAVIPIAWSAEAVALAWVARTRRHEHAALAAVILGGLAVLSIPVMLYPLRELATSIEPALPFASQRGATLGFVLAAIAATAFLAGGLRLRTSLAALAALLIAWALPAELSSVALVAGFAAVFGTCLVADRVLVRPAATDADQLARHDAPDAEVRPPETRPSWPIRLWAMRPAEVDELGLRALQYAGLAALVAAVLHVVTFEYPPADLFGRDSAGGFSTPAALAVLAILVAIGFVAAVWTDVKVRAGLLGLASGLVGYMLPFELSGVPLVAAWVALAAGTLALGRILGLPIDPRLRRPDRLTSAPMIAAAAAALLASLHALAFDLAPFRALAILAGRAAPPAVPFVDAPTAVAVILALGIGIVSALARGDQAARRGRPGGNAGERRAAPWPPLVAVGALAGYLALFELPAWLAIDAIAALAIAAAFLAPRLEGSRLPLHVAAISAVAVGLAMTLLFIAPVDRLAVDPTVRDEHLPFLTPATAAVSGLVVAAVLIGRWGAFRRYLAHAAVAAGALVVYGLSIGLVDEFQGWVGGPVSLEELQKQASVALTVLWAACGGLAFGFGLWRNVVPARYAGLALLGLATAKAFLIDLAGLDVAYRVLSFVGLGILLLGSAFLAQQSRRGRGGATRPGDTP